MAIRNIREIGDGVLNKKCKEVKEMTPRTKELIEDMLETMYEANGVGLGVDTVRVEFKTIDEFYHLVNRHAVTQDSGYEFGIIPILRIEFVRQSFYSGLKSGI